MPVQTIPIDRFMALASQFPVLDVRSPGEYAHAHMPGAYSLPLFSDEERAKIGTAYKQLSRESAIKIGLDAFGPRMRPMVEQVEAIVQAAGHSAGTADAPNVLVHCWRGGMRSAAVAWLLDLYGFRVHLLEGGYKAYRHWVLRGLSRGYNFRVIGGNTGAGKTAVLHVLRHSGWRVLDLEQIAGHKGSAFGGLGAPAQPGQEQFENNLAGQLLQLSADDEEAAIYVEDESQRIGTVNLPQDLYTSIRDAPQYFLDVPFEARLDYILQEYGSFPTEALVNATLRIKKRLGPLETRTAVGHLIEGDRRACFAILLHYYDKLYRKALAGRGPGAGQIHRIDCLTADAGENTRSLMTHLRHNDAES